MMVNGHILLQNSSEDGQDNALSCTIIRDLSARNDYNTIYGMDY